MAWEKQVANSLRKMLFLPDGETASFVRYRESINRIGDEKYEPDAPKPPIIYDCDTRWTTYYQNTSDEEMRRTMANIRLTYLMGPTSEWKLSGRVQRSNLVFDELMR